MNSTPAAVLLFALLIAASDAQERLVPSEDDQPNKASSHTADDVKRAVKIRRLIGQLDSDSFQAREDAHRQLVEVGKPAVEALRFAAMDRSTEVRVRSRLILSQMLGPGLSLHLSMDSQDLALGQSKHLSSVPDRSKIKDRAILFPGEGCLVVPDRAELDTDTRFTLAAWICPTKIVYTRWEGHKDRKDEPIYPWGEHPASWSGHFIACKWQSQGTNGDYIFALTPSGKLGLGVANRESKFVADSLCTAESIPVDKWVHVAATFDTGKMKLYIDGKLAVEKHSTTVTHTNTREYGRDDIYIGSFWNHSPRAPYNFHGVIDEFCLFRQALSEKQVQRLMALTE